VPTTPICPNAFPLVDHDLLISMDTYVGITYINKFGHNANVAIGVEEEIWDGSVAYTFPTTATMTKLNTTADVEAMRGETVELLGLDVNWAEVLQTVTLDASNTTTFVVLDTPLIRCFRMKFLSSVVSTSSITLVNAADNVLYANIDSGNNQTLMAIYTVPVGKTAYMTNYYAHVNPGTNLDPTAMPIRLWARDNANLYAPQIKHVFGLIEGSFQHFFTPHKKFTEKTDIYMTAQPVGKAADVTAGFDLILIQENIQ
jgi:hypothetical protein